MNQEELGQQLRKHFDESYPDLAKSKFNMAAYEIFLNGASTITKIMLENKPEVK